ncbi:MAG: hypothetical protein N2449_09020 [Bacteroidales bacterium]|nr:hypothetical protein [Bacteroidales bacterium]
MKNLFIFTVAVAFIFSSCGKYEDGPAFSLASKKSRVVNVWQLDKSFHNGVEVQLSADDKDDYMEFTKDNKLKITWVGQGQTYTVEGTWEFDDKKENLITKITYMGVTSVDTSKILRLKSNEMWLEYKNGNDVHKDYYISKK